MKKTNLELFSGNFAPRMHLGRFASGYWVMIGRKVQYPLQHSTVPPSGKASYFWKDSCLREEHECQTFKYGFSTDSTCISSPFQSHLYTGSQQCPLSSSRFKSSVVYGKSTKLRYLHIPLTLEQD